ncbi:DUF6194 family protein [Nocardia shimofusensis]|uniref:DUF6194 family protein n=1 Tax=Nocardia shimofusensis TaxID=228596 RepID=UPI000834A31B|nr:DUF6194 family protein [Nocardia shimofusensis]
MTIDEIIEFTESLGGVLTLRPGPGDGSPELAWGDLFFYYAPDGQVPTATQPFATVVTKNYPGDELSRLDRPGAFRLNIDAGREGFETHLGRAPRTAAADSEDPSVEDTLVAHPVYGGAGWVAVVNPGPRSTEVCRDLLRVAHARAHTRSERRRTR